MLPGSVRRFTELLASERACFDKLIREAHIQPD